MDDQHSSDVVAPEVPKGPSARERILDVSAERFGRQGIQAVGIDGIIDQADVAKATLYKQFHSKDELILAWLRSQHARWIDWVTVEVEQRTAVPRERLVVLFDVLEEWFERDDFQGCAYQNTAAEVRGTDQPIRVEVRAYVQEVEDWLRGLVEAAQIPHADRLAEQLHVLVAGAFWLSFIKGSSSPATTARSAAMVLLEAIPSSYTS